MAPSPGASVAGARGKSVGNFTVEREIGRGGMGVVFYGRQPNLDRPVVLKKLRRDLAALPEIVERFQREARAASAVHHQNVVAVYDCFTWRGDHYIAQEFVDGIDLGAVLARVRRIPPRLAAQIALEALRGLETIHARGTVHRDLKPANILLGRRGEVKIGDFGIALDPSGPALTQPGILLGTPPYMPPEQMLGERVDARGDLFSMGVVLYEMLTGSVPFWLPKDSETETLLSQMRRERYPRVRKHAPDTPRFLAKRIHACLKPKPRWRPSEAAELRRMLERRLPNPSPADCRQEIARWLWASAVLETREGETVVVPAAPRSAPRSRPRWMAATFACAALCAAILMVHVHPAPLRDQATAEPSARLRLRVGPSVVVRIDEGPALSPSGEAAIALRPGSHRVRFQAPEQEPVIQELVLQAGEERLLRSPFGSKPQTPR